MAQWVQTSMCVCVCVVVVMCDVYGATQDTTHTKRTIFTVGSFFLSLHWVQGSNSDCQLCTPSTLAH